MMNTPALWYMCKYCMTPFYNLSDLNIHKQWFHPHAHSLSEQTNCPGQVDQFGKANSLGTVMPDDKKFKPNNMGEKHDYSEKGKIEDKNKIDLAQWNLKPEIGIKREEAFHHGNNDHHAHSSTEFPGIGMPIPMTSKSDYQNYSALSFDLSMLKPKSDPVIETLPISELDAFFSKEQINQVAFPRNLSPNRAKSHNNMEHHNILNEPTVAPIKKEKKKRLPSPKNYALQQQYNIPQPQPPLLNDVVSKPGQKAKRKRTSTNQKSRKSVGNYSCCFCGDKFDDPEKLKIHELDEGLHFGGVRTGRSQPGQSNEPQLPVPVYGLPVAGEDNLYRCRYCPKQVAHRWSLIRHERKHTGEKRFRCQYCQKPIDDKCALAIHERTHTGERPYKCQHCDATFARRSSTKRHELAHIGIKPKSYPRRRR